MSEGKKNKFQSLAGRIKSYPVKSIQVNLGMLCNLYCHHCHLAASPLAEEVMPWKIMEKVLEAVDSSDGITLVDITGGAPELNPHLRSFISALERPGREIKLRTNLTVLLEPACRDLAKFLADNRVHLAASLPCYLESNVRSQRGNGTFEKSIAALEMLNNLGYGQEGGARLDLVHNPGGPFLPGCEKELETDYRKELQRRYGISFTALKVITNMPIGRFRKMLEQTGRLMEYLDLLYCSFNREVIGDLMCRSQVSVGWDGTLYDCDFNLALGYPLAVEEADIVHFNRERLTNRYINTGDHCFGCTAGAGSSCSGALEEGVN